MSCRLYGRDQSTRSIVSGATTAEHSCERSTTPRGAASDSVISTEDPTVTIHSDLIHSNGSRQGSAPPERRWIPPCTVPLERAENVYCTSTTRHYPEPRGLKEISVTPVTETSFRLVLRGISSRVYTYEDTSSRPTRSVRFAGRLASASELCVPGTDICLRTTSLLLNSDLVAVRAQVDLEEVARRRDARVVDQHVNGAERLAHPGEPGFDGRRLREARTPRVPIPTARQCRKRAPDLVGPGTRETGRGRRDE